MSVAVAALAAAYLTIAGVAEMETLACPSSLVGTPPTGWTLEGTAGRAPLPLRGVTVFDGPPEEGASLVPDRQVSRPKPLDEWRVGAYGSSRIWVVCRYGASGPALKRRLEAGYSVCRASATDASGKELMFSCE